MDLLGVVPPRWLHPTLGRSREAGLDILDHIFLENRPGQNAHVLTDDEIARLTPAARQQLMARLQRTGEERATVSRFDRRTLNLLVLSMSAAVLIPWTVYLEFVLPRSYTTRNWNSTWVGFDILLVVALVTTALLAFHRRQLVSLTAFGVGVMLLCDAWFDFMTSTAPRDHPAAVLSLLLEVPLALFFIAEAVNLMVRTGVRTGLVGPRARPWQVPIPAPDGKRPVDPG